MKNINSEAEFEKRIRDIIKNDILPKNNNLIILDFQKATDILICRNGDHPKLFFIEVKYYNTSHGRLGFGHGDGKGFQPEVLRKNPDFFKKNMRWIIGSIEKEDYYLVDNETVLKYVSGGSIDYKHNNIQIKIFEDQNGLNKNEFCNKLIEWLTD